MRIAKTLIVNVPRVEKKFSRVNLQKLKVELRFLGEVSVLPAIVVYVDGLCEPVNPGGVATYGYAVRNGTTAGVVRKFGVVGCGPEMSNNVAEYAALCEVLEFLLNAKMNRLPIEVRSDSRLLVNQMNGIWRAHKGLYVEKYLEAKNLTGQFDRITFKWIPREENGEADALSREAYSEATDTVTA